MAETKQLLERAKRAFDPPSDVMDALVDRRDRKRRDQRIRAGVLGLAIAIGVGWLGVVAIRSTPQVPAVPPDLPNTPESWSRVQLDPPVAGGDGPSILVAGPDRLAAVGVPYGGPATAWTSSDGATWTRTASEDLDRTDIYDIRSGGPGFIATGSDGPTAGTGEPTIWTSEDGVSWNRLPDDPVFGDTLFISAVAPGGPGLVAVGSWMGAWYSSDGMTWERASVPPVPPEVYPGDDGETPQVYLSDLADQGDRLVATGEALLDDGGNLDHHVVVVWTSRDGRSWTDVPTPADVFPQDSSISEIAAGPDGFVAVGQITVGEVSTPAIWSSPDGRDWRLHRPGPDGLELSSVAAADGGYVAVGATISCTTGHCASREAVVMTSVDGETWVRVPSGPEFRVAEPADPENARGAAMFQVVAWGSRFAALGEYDGEPTVWVTPGVEEDVTTPTPPEPDDAGSTPLWPQTSLEQVRRAQELADAGDPRSTWQVAPDLEGQVGQHHPSDAEIFGRFLEEELGWDDYRWDEAAAHPDGLDDGDVVYIRCAPGGTNPLYPDDPEGGCGPTIDDLRYETVKINVAQLDRQGPTGIWVVTGWEEIEPFEQVAPPSDAEITALLDAFLQARFDGHDAEGFADVAEYDELADVRVDREIPLLYATSTGASYERSEFELVDGPVWPEGSMRLEVRLFADNGATTVEQVFSLERDETGRLRLVYDFGPTGPDGRPILATTENGKAVPVEYGFLDGEVTYRAAEPAAPYSGTIWEQGPDVATIVGTRERRLLLILADPRPIGPGCEEAPAPADAEALARSIRSDSDFEATTPVPVTIAGIPALQMDVALAPAAGACPWQLPNMSSTTPLLLEHAPLVVQGADRARLYLLDLAGGSARVLAIAILSDKDSFEHALEVAAPIVDSIEFHPR